MTRSIDNIIKEWAEQGFDRHPRHPEHPLHPELVYREIGVWRGWSYFRGTPPEDVDAIISNYEKDELEDAAYLRWTNNELDMEEVRRVAFVKLRLKSRSGQHHWFTHCHWFFKTLP